MEDVAHVRLVDPHPEGDHGDDDDARIGHEDAALAFMAGDETPQLALPVAFHLHRQLDVGAVEAEDEGFHRATEQPLGHVLAGHFVGGCRERGDGNPGEEFPQPAQILVFGAEGRAPLGDAMGLVDGEQRHRQPA